MNFAHIEELFTYHKPNAVAEDAITQAAKVLGRTILSYGDNAEDMQAAIMKLRECVLYAISSVPIPEQR